MHCRVAFIKHEFPRFLRPEPTELIEERHCIRPGICDSENNCRVAYLKSLCIWPVGGAEDDEEVVGEVLAVFLMADTQR